MTEVMNTLQDWLSNGYLFNVGRALALLVAGFALARLSGLLVQRVSGPHLSPHQSLMLRRVVSYGLLTLFVISALHELGFNLQVLLGAAGILTVAVGFASQTAASNLISGLFLLGERPFAIGDVIRIGTTLGEVVSIDLLSVKLRTPDNLYVRIPNETLLKAETTTMTRYPIRRIDLIIGVAYKEDLRKVQKVLQAVAEANLNCLDEPRPVTVIEGFNASSMDIKFMVWTKRELFLDTRRALFEEIKEAFDVNGIEIPFPHVSLYAGEASKPMPVEIVRGTRRQG